jgi:hypothetical protein
MQNNNNPSINKLMILKGKLSGSLQKYKDKQIDVKNLHNFIKDPIFNIEVFDNVYIILTKYIKEGSDIPNPYYNIQVLFVKSDKTNLLELGSAILMPTGEFRFNMTEEAAVLGTLTPVNNSNLFYVNRFCNAGTIFIDQGYFRPITPVQFVSETNVKLPI